MTTPNPYGAPTSGPDADSQAPSPGPYGPVPPSSAPGPYGTAPVTDAPAYGAPSPFQATYQAPYQAPSPYDMTPYRPTNTMATLALILSLAGLGTWITAPAGAICGHVALRQIRENPNQQGHGIALTAVIIGWIITALGLLVIGYFVWAIMLIAQNA